MKVLRDFLDGFEHTDEEKALLERVRTKENTIVQEVGQLMQRGELPPLLAVRAFRGCRLAARNVFSGLKKELPED